MDCNRAVADAIADAIAAAHADINTVADAAGVPQKTLKRFLQGNGDIKVTQVVAIAGALHRDIADLIPTPGAVA